MEGHPKRLETYGKQSTVRTRRCVANNLIRFFRNPPVETFTSADLESYINQRMGVVARSTINGELKNLKATLRFAVEEKLLAAMPLRIKMIPVVTRRTARIFTRQEIQRLLDSADERVRCLLLIASATGMRLGEIKHLQWRDIDFTAHRISVTAKEGWTPKTCHERSAYVSAEVIDLLARSRTRQAYNTDHDWGPAGQAHAWKALGIPRQLEPFHHCGVQEGRPLPEGEADPRNPPCGRLHHAAAGDSDPRGQGDPRPQHAEDDRVLPPPSA